MKIERIIASLGLMYYLAQPIAVASSEDISKLTEKLKTEGTHEVFDDSLAKGYGYSKRFENVEFDGKIYDKVEIGFLDSDNGHDKLVVSLFRTNSKGFYLHSLVDGGTEGLTLDGNLDGSLKDYFSVEDSIKFLLQVFSGNSQDYIRRFHNKLAFPDKESRKLYDNVINWYLEGK